MTTFCSPWIAAGAGAGAFSSSDEFPATPFEKSSKLLNDKGSVNPITDALRVKFSEIDLRPVKSTNYATKMAPLTRHHLLESPPLCSICKHKSPVFGAPAKWFSFKELEEATDGFSEVNFLAEGGFGSVHRGVLCVEGGRRLLVYEYVCNGSLDSHLYGTIVDIVKFGGFRYLNEQI